MCGLFKLRMLVAAVLGFALVAFVVAAVLILRSPPAPTLAPGPGPGPAPGPGPGPGQAHAPGPGPAHAPAPGREPPLPSWARMVIDDRVRAAHARCKGVVDQANRTGTRYDVVMWGDSITAALAGDAAGEWRAFSTGWRAAALGVGGTSVEELTWRVMAGGERFSKDPRVVILLVGIINLKHTRSDPAERLDFLLGWMRAAMPSSRIVLLNLLPNDQVGAAVRATNAKYERLAAKHGCVWSTCGSDMGPGDLKDGTHPSASGYRRLLGCLRPVVAREL